MIATCIDVFLCGDRCDMLNQAAGPIKARIRHFAALRRGAVLNICVD